MARPVRLTTAAAPTRPRAVLSRLARLAAAEVEVDPVLPPARPPHPPAAVVPEPLLCTLSAVARAGLAPPPVHLASAPRQATTTASASRRLLIYPSYDECLHVYDIKFVAIATSNTCAYLWRMAGCF
jgi:hypothetical protein